MRDRVGALQRTARKRIFRSMTEEITEDRRKVHNEKSNNFHPCVILQIQYNYCV